MKFHQKDINLDYATYRLKGYEDDFEKKAKEFAWIMEHGGGINNIHIFDVIKA